MKGFRTHPRRLHAIGWRPKGLSVNFLSGDLKESQESMQLSLNAEFPIGFGLEFFWLR